jgi:hypothetical protein
MQRLYELLEEAIRIQSAVSGKVRVISEDQTHLDLVAQRGLSPSFASNFARIGTADAAPASKAFRKNARVYVADVAHDVRSSLYATACLEEGFTAMHATPISSPSGNVLGTLSTLYRVRPQISAAEAIVLDHCAGRLGATLCTLFDRA